MSTVLKFPRRARRRVRGRKKIQEAVAADLSSLRIILDRFVFDERRGTFYRVSESAAFIVAELKKGRPHNQLSETYAERYAVPRAIAERDVELLLNDIAAVQLAAGAHTHPANC